MEPPPSYADAVAQQQQQNQPKRLPSQQFQQQHQSSVLHILQQPRPSNPNPVTVHVVPSTPPRVMPNQAGVTDTRRGWHPFVKFVIILGAALTMLTFIKLARKMDERRHPRSPWW